MRLRLWLLALLGLLAPTSHPLAQPATPLDGAWRAIAAERNGAWATDVVGHVLTFAGDAFTITRDGVTLFAGTYKADAAQKPARIDFAVTNGPKKETWRGIYALDGAALKIVDNAPDPTKPRPTAFTAPVGSGHIFVAFSRVAR